MPRITISIPMVLRERLNDPQIRKSINVSRICQEALNREVRKMVEVPEDFLKIDRLISRFRKEAQQHRDQWFFMGVNEARDWVEHDAPYALLRQLGELPLEKRLVALRKAPPPQLFQSLQRHRQNEGFSEMSFLEGFAYMTQTLWEILQKNL